MSPRRRSSWMGRLLKWATEESRGDREVVMAAVWQAGVALRWAAQETKGVPRYRLWAARQEGKALGRAAEGMQGWREIVMAAAQHTAGGEGLALGGPGHDGEPRYRHGMAAVQQYGKALRHAAQAMKGGRDTVAAAVQQDRAHRFFAELAGQAERYNELANHKENVGKRETMAFLTMAFLSRNAACSR